MKKTLAIAAIFLTAACVNKRAPEPIATQQKNDAQLNCNAIAKEYKANSDEAFTKISDNNAADKVERAKAILLWPGLIDLKNADGNEGNALLDRNLYLLQLAKGKSCNTATWPTQTARYK